MGFRILGTNAQSAAPALTKMLSQTDSLYVQVSTIAALGAIGPAAKGAVPLVLGCATNSDWVLRRTALFSLGQILSYPEQVLPVLTNAMHDSTVNGLCAHGA